MAIGKVVRPDWKGLIPRSAWSMIGSRKSDAEKPIMPTNWAALQARKRRFLKRRTSIIGSLMRSSAKTKAVSKDCAGDEKEDHEGVVEAARTGFGQAVKHRAEAGCREHEPVGVEAARGRFLLLLEKAPRAYTCRNRPRYTMIGSCCDLLACDGSARLPVPGA